jgi:hypothetical protein
LGLSFVPLMQMLLSLSLSVDHCLHLWDSSLFLEMIRHLWFVT